MTSRSLNVYDNKEKEEIIEDLSLNGNHNLAWYNSLYLYSWVDKELASDQIINNPIEEKTKSFITMFI